MADVEAALADVVSCDGFPFTLVALRDERFVGTVTSIHSDIDARPKLGPCVAALWVEPEVRRSGIGGAMVKVVLHRLKLHGFSEVYLSAKPGLRTFYEPRGWSIIEHDIDDDHQDVYVRSLSPAARGQN